MSEYNYGPLEHELAGGQCADDCHFGDRDEPPAPRAGERKRWRLEYYKRGTSEPWLFCVTLPSGAIIARTINEHDAKQIIAEHNQHATLTDRLAAQTESLAKVVSERNELRKQRNRLVVVLKQLMIRFEQTGEAWMSDPAMIEAREAIATIEREEV